MDKVSFIKVDDINGNPLDFAIIDKGEGAYTSMLKSDYDRLQVAQVEHLTEIPTKEAYLATLASELSNPSTP